MFTEYDRRQQARERAALTAKAELACHEAVGELPPHGHRRYAPLFEACGLLVFDPADGSLKVVQSHE